MCSRNNYNDDVVLDEIELIEVDGWEAGGRGPPKHKVVLKACYLIFENKYKNLWEMHKPIQARTRNLSAGENVQKWTRYFLLFFPTRPSDEYDSASCRKYSRPLLDVFACIG